MRNRHFDRDGFDELELGPLPFDTSGIPKDRTNGSPEKDRVEDVEDVEDLPFPEVWEPFEDDDPTEPETPRVIELPPPEEQSSTDDAAAEAPAEKTEEEAPLEPPADPMEEEAPPEPVDADPPPHERLRPGDVVAGRYEIVERLPLGGIGAWYRVVAPGDPDTEALCVLPEAAARPRVRQRLTQQCELSQTLRHPGVTALLDVGEDAERGLLFVAAESVEGISLRTALEDRGGRLPTWEALDTGLQLCDALAAIHRRAAHQALSPDSVVMQPDGTVKLLDLGLASAIPLPVLSSEVAVRENKAYRAPELAQWTEDGDARADLYSLGVILYRMFTGRLPDEPPLPPSHAAVGVPRAVDDIVLQCLRPRPEDRPRNVGAVRKALQKAAGSPSRHPLLAPLVAATLLLVAVVPLLVQLARDPAEAAWAQAARFVPPPTPPVEAEAEAPPSAEAEAPLEPEEPEIIPIPEPDDAVEASEAEPTLPEEPAAALVSPAAKAPEPEPVPEAVSEPVDEEVVILPDPEAAEEEVVIVPAPEPDGDEPEEPAAPEPEPVPNRLARTSPSPAPVELAPRASISIGEIRSSDDPPADEAPSAPDPRGTLISAPAYAVEFVRLVEGAGRYPHRAEVRYRTLGGGERVQIISVGDEVGDGWRLESIDPVKPSIRLRKGARTASLTAVAPRAADAPKPPAATQTLEATRASALRARTEAEAVRAEALASEAFDRGVYALNEAEAWKSAGWKEEALQYYKKAETHFDEATAQALREAVRSRSTAAAPAPEPFRMPATGNKQGPSPFYEAEG